MFPVYEGEIRCAPLTVHRGSTPSRIHRRCTVHWRVPFDARVMRRMDELATLHPDHVFLRREALEFGYSDKQLYSALRAGVVVRIRHGAYVHSPFWTEADDLERHRMRSHAVLRSHSSKLALSHTSAAVEHGLRLYKPDLSKVHVTCLDGMIGNDTQDVVYHRLPCTESDLVLTPTGQLAVTALRAGIEAASLASIAQGMVILDSVVDFGIASADEVRSAYGRMAGPRSRRLQITVRLVREGSNSIGESLSRKLFHGQRVPEPVLQFEVHDENGVLIGRTDFAWPDYGVLGEFDGKSKYLRLRRANETIEEAVVREKLREDALREITGWLMIRLIWADLFTPTVTGERVHRQLQRGQRLLAA